MHAHTAENLRAVSSVTSTPEWDPVVINPAFCKTSRAVLRIDISRPKILKFGLFTN